MQTTDSVLNKKKVLRVLTEQKFDYVGAPMEVNLKNVCAGWQFKTGQLPGKQNFQKNTHTH